MCTHTIDKSSRRSQLRLSKRGFVILADTHNTFAPCLAALQILQALGDGFQPVVYLVIYGWIALPARE
jgi:hypothetical protein